jgi:hypothetical protein
VQKSRITAKVLVGIEGLVLALHLACEVELGEKIVFSFEELKD